MIQIKSDDICLIEGGLSVSGTLINSFVAGIKILLEVGRSLGSTIRRGGRGQKCEI